jgi:hypothetical protein
MDATGAMQGTVHARRVSVAGRATAAAAGLALVAALWGGFAVGRGTAPATRDDAPPASGVRPGGAGMPPVVEPIGDRGPAKAGWDSTRGPEVRIRPGPHHRVKGL